MADTIKKLGEAEVEIMQVIWDSDAPVTSGFILKKLQTSRKWQLSTLMTSLSRLADKGFVKCDRSMGVNLYTALISENQYKTGASKHFLEKLYHNSVRNMVAALYDDKALKESDVKELREFLDKLGTDSGEKKKKKSSKKDIAKAGKNKQAEKEGKKR